MLTVDERVADLIAEAPPLTQEQILGVVRIIVRERARSSRVRTALNGGGGSRAA